MVDLHEFANASFHDFLTNNTNNRGTNGVHFAGTDLSKLFDKIINTDQVSMVFLGKCKKLFSASLDDHGLEGAGWLEFHLCRV